jgi:hypothetical protein
MDDIVFTGPWITSSLSFSNGNCVQCTGWRKSSRSMSNGQCAEVAPREGGIAVRDSKDPAGPALFFAADAWRKFAASLKAATIAS